MATYFIADRTQLRLPSGAVVHQDCVATYLKNIPPDKKPVVVYVARNLQVLRLSNSVVNHKGKVEKMLDSGSQIVCMALTEALRVGLTWDLEIKLHMESANKQVNDSVGLVEGFTVYLQVHIYEKPAYTVLLGRLFDTLTESNIQNLQDGSAIITI
ncbi:hypothetical protein J132_00195 [Termitomyces sp. J132]|nr:hypothetical protein J132_00195 [Termitomyces sp. J132]